MIKPESKLALNSDGQYWFNNAGFGSHSTIYMEGRGTPSMMSYVLYSYNYGLEGIATTWQRFEGGQLALTGSDSFLLFAVQVDVPWIGVEITGYSTGELDVYHFGYKEGG